MMIFTKLYNVFYCSKKNEVSVELSYEVDSRPTAGRATYYPRVRNGLKVGRGLQEFVICLI